MGGCRLSFPPELGDLETGRHGWGEGATQPPSVRVPLAWGPQPCPGCSAPHRCIEARPLALDKPSQEQITIYFLYCQRLLVTNSGGIHGGCR